VSLEKTLEYASKVGVVKSELGNAQALVDQLKEEVACLIALKVGVEGRNLAEVDEQLKEAERLKLTEQEEGNTNVFSWPSTTEEAARALIIMAKDLNKILQAEAEAALKDLTGRREALLAKIREVCDRAAGLILSAGAEAKVDTCEVLPMEELLAQALELEIAEDVGEIEFAKSLVGEVREKEKQAKVKQRNMEKETGRMIRSAQKRKDLVKLRVALEKGAMVLKEDHPDMVSGNALLQDLIRKDEQKTAKADMKQFLLESNKIRKDPNATTMMEQQGLKNLQTSLRKALSLGFNESNLPEIVQARELISNLQSSLETKIAKNFLQSNGFSNRDWMAGSRQRNRTKDGKFIQLPPVDLSIVDVNNELWLVFTHYTVRLNAKEPEIMRKDAYMTLMRDCNIVSPRAKRGKVMEADMNTIHGVVQSQSPGRRFVFSSFKKTLGKIAVKVFPERDTGVRAAQAMEKLLSEWILPHAHKRLKIPIAEQTSLPEIVELSKIFAPSLKLIFQFFAVMPSPEEKKAGRHKKRRDIDEFIGQSMKYDAFMSFASVFSLSSGTGSSQAALNTTDLAAIFLDSILVEEVDTVGGLTYEEFWQALVRMALVFYSRRTSHDAGGSKKKDGEGEGALEEEGEGESIYDTIIHLFIWMNECMTDAVPRAISAQEQFVFNKEQFAMSNQGEILQKGAKSFAKQVATLDRKKDKGDEKNERMAMDGTGNELDRQLWAVFTHYSMHSGNPDTMRKDALVNLMRSCGLVRGKRPKKGDNKKLMEAEINSVHQNEASKTASRKFVFSSFKHAIQQFGTKLNPKMSPPDALEAFLTKYIAPSKQKRLRVLVDQQMLLQDVIALQEKFSPSLKQIFQFFAQAPTSDELDVLHRHARRSDISSLKQSLHFERFLDFAIAFDLSNEFSNSELAAVFLDAIDVEMMDSVGGLTYEEFWQACLRLALLMNTAWDGEDGVRVDEQVLSLFVYISTGDPWTNMRQSSFDRLSNHDQAQFNAAVKAFQKCADSAGGLVVDVHELTAMHHKGSNSRGQTHEYKLNQEEVNMYNNAMYANGAGHKGSEPPKMDSGDQAQNWLKLKEHVESTYLNPRQRAEARRAARRNSEQAMRHLNLLSTAGLTKENVQAPVLKGPKISEIPKWESRGKRGHKHEDDEGSGRTPEDEWAVETVEDKKKKSNRVMNEGETKRRTSSFVASRSRSASRSTNDMHEMLTMGAETTAGAADSRVSDTPSRDHSGSSAHWSDYFASNEVKGGSKKGILPKSEKEKKRERERALYRKQQSAGGNSAVSTSATSAAAARSAERRRQENASAGRNSTRGGSTARGSTRAVAARGGDGRGGSDGTAGRALAAGAVDDGGSQSRRLSRKGSTTQLTTVSRDEMAKLHGILEALFSRFKESNGITSSGCVRFCKTCKLLDKKLTITEVSMIFAAVKLGKRKDATLNFDRFQEAVRKMAQKKGCTYQELCVQASHVTEMGAGEAVGGTGGKKPGFKTNQSAFATSFASYGY
jgi:hypothetical protein